MSQTTNADELDKLFDPQIDIDFEQSLDDRFSTKGVDTQNGSWVPETPRQSAQPAQPVKKADTRTAKQRIDDLYHQMAPQHLVFNTILQTCKKRAPFDEVEAAVGQITQYMASVYSAANYCCMLKAAGALARVTDDGTPYDQYVNEPELVVVDGQEFLRPRPAPKSYWELTQEGCRRLEAYDPHAQLQEIYAEHPQVLPIFKRVLTLLAQSQDGLPLSKIADAVDDDPLVQKPRFYAGHFLERLERADAVQWRDAWCITQIGRESLEQLEDVEDAGAPADED